jgi:uncharacterized membrane protein YdjX (TVP38/TMEM64 family)
MKTQVKTTIFFITAILIVAVGLYFLPPQDDLRRILKGIPLWFSAPVFILLYVAANFVVIDIKDAFKLIGAIVFGAWASALLIYIAELLNAVIFFNLSRKFGQAFVQRILKNGAVFYDKLSDFKLHWVFLLRAIPVVPYRVLDIVFGLSKMRFGRYMLAVALASFPRVLFIQIPLAAVGSFSVPGFMDYWRANPGMLLAGFLYIVFTLLGIVALHFKLQKTSKSVVK